MGQQCTFHTFRVAGLPLNVTNRRCYSLVRVKGPEGRLTKKGAGRAAAGPNRYAGGAAAQPVQRSTVMSITGPAGGLSRYCR
jgi:hypothetical protein